MEHYAGIDVSLESASLCVVDAAGRIVREAKAASEPEVLIDAKAEQGTKVLKTPKSGARCGPASTISGWPAL
jgi:hypothetical protein